MNGQCKKGEEKWRVYAEGLKGMVDGQGEDINGQITVNTVLASAGSVKSESVFLAQGMM